MSNKIVVSTYCTGHNYGSILQAYALNKFLLNKGYCPQIIANKYEKVSKIGAIFKSLLFPKKMLKQFKSSLSAKRLVSQNQHNIFNNDIKKLNCKRMSFLSAYKFSKGSLCCICGSDQIWKGDALYLNKFYFLQFSDLKKNIAYAPSLGVDFINKSNIKRFQKYLEKINFISTREKINCNLLSDISCGKDVHYVCDPTFLISFEEWSSMGTLQKEKDDYIVCYLLDIPDFPTAINIVEKIKKANAKVIFLGQSMKKYADLFSFSYCFSEISSFDFPKLIFNSSAVITDSFHGIVFSLIGRKKAYWFDRNYVDNISQNVRIIDLLKNLDIEIENNELLYSFKTFDILNNIVNNSKKYLLNSIEEVSNEYIKS